MKKGRIFIVLSILMGFFAGCATTAQVREEAPADKTVITGIDVKDDSIEIKGSRPFIYTTYRPSDPYRVVVEIPDADLGAFRDTIKPGNPFITEVTPSQIDSPKRIVRVDVLLQSPSDLEPAYHDTTLLLKVKRVAEPGGAGPEAGKGIAGTAAPEIVNAIAYEKVEAREVLKEGAGGIKEEGSPEPAKETPQNAEQPLPKATEIREIGFEHSDGVIKVTIKGNGAMSPSVFTLKDRIVIDIPDVTMKAVVPDTVMAPVKGLRVGKHKDKTRLVLDLKKTVGFDVTSIRDTITIAIQSPEMVVAKREAPEPGIEKKEAGEGIGPAAKEAAEAKEPETLVEGKYTGKKISLDFQDADIVPIFRLLADISGYNIVVDPNVKGRLTMKLVNVPWDQALDLICKTFYLGQAVEGNIIRIAPLSVFAKESEEKAKAKEAEAKAEPLETRFFSISYADVSVVEKSIKDSKILSTRGSISVDKRTSSMVIKDVPSVFPQVENFLSTLDKPTPQVLIEARIVEVSTKSDFDLGIQWGVTLSATNTLSSIGGLSTLGKGSFTGGNYLVDFPSGKAGAGSGSGFNFGLLNPARTMGLDLQISALETMGKGRIISNPRVVTLDNEKAIIMQGTSEPYPEITEQGTITVKPRDVVLKTEVTPHITPTGSISMSVVITKEDIIGERLVGGTSAPRTSKVEGNTKVLVQNGETLVIGGIYKRTERESTSGVPGLMKIPVLGWLFKNRNVSEDVGELLIFITPRIVELPARTTSEAK